MRYLLTNEILDAVLSASNGDSNYPVRNLQDRFLQKRFQSSGTISQITSLMNTVAACNCIAQGFTNATSIYSYLYGAGQGIFKEYTNLVLDPNDLRAGGANWAATNTTDELSTLSINGNLFTKIINSGANAGFNSQTFTDPFTNLILTGQVTLKKGESVDNVTAFRIRNNTAAAFIFNLVIDWDNFESNPGTPSQGTLLDYDWIDSETLLLRFECVALANLTDDVIIRCFGSDNATDGEYTYWSEVQFIDDSEIIMFPFVDGTHAVDIINETFTLPNQFTRVIKIDPRISFDTATSHIVYSFFIDTTHLLKLVYAPSIDKYQLVWHDGGTVRDMRSQQFDDGSSFTDINQILYFVISADLKTGSQTGSRFLIITENGTVVTEFTSWLGGVPDIMSLVFPTNSEGHQANIQQADSVIYFDITYEGLLLGPMNNITNVFDAVSDKTLLYEFEPDSVVFDSSVTHNIDDDTDFTYFDSVNVKQIVTTVEGPTGVYLGGLGAGTYLQLPDPLADFDRPLRDNSFVDQSPSGQVLNNYEKPLIAPSFRFPPVLPALANQIRDGYINIGKGFPFYADFFEDDRTFTFYAPLYCFFRNEPGDQKNSKRIEYAIDLLEAR